MAGKCKRKKQLTKHTKTHSGIVATPNADEDAEKMGSSFFASRIVKY